MTKPAFKSRSWIRKKVKTPGNRVVTHYRRKKPKGAKCAKCKKLLQAIPRVRPAEMKKIPKSKKRPNRPYGGNLCSSCMREVIREKVRKG